MAVGQLSLAKIGNILLIGKYRSKKFGDKI